MSLCNPKHEPNTSSQTTSNTYVTVSVGLRGVGATIFGSLLDLDPEVLRGRPRGEGGGGMLLSGTRDLVGLELEGIGGRERSLGLLRVLWLVVSVFFPLRVIKDGDGVLFLTEGVVAGATATGCDSVCAVEATCPRNVA